MIDFYTWKTPNCQKVAIMLEELQIPYKICPVNIAKQEQFSPGFLKINPNNKIPVIVDQQGPDGESLTLSESGAILLYLAEKQNQFLSSDPRTRIKTLQWLMFQMSAVGPMLGQVHHFLHYAAEHHVYSIERYLNEARRIYSVMDAHLEKHTFFMQEYSIADIAIFPWVNLHERQRIDLNEYTNLQRWHDLIANRPAVTTALSLI